MEPRFKTSFIPKESLAASPEPNSGAMRSAPGPRGIGIAISVIIFIGTMGFAGGLFVYEQYLQRSIVEKKSQLSRAREAFQPALIRQMARLDIRLASAEILLNEHTASSLFFALLEQITLQTVRFMDLDLSFEDGEVTFSMQGQAQNFTAVALQSDVMGSNQYIREPLLSDFAVGEDGTVNFSVKGSVDPRLLLYGQSVLVNEEPVTQDGQDQ